jgi:hypothetical protein
MSINQRCLERNKIKHRKKYKIWKSPTPLGKISLSCTPPGVRFYISSTRVRNYMNVFHNKLERILYIINATTTAINTYKRLFEFVQREAISFFTLVTKAGEHSIIYSK